MTTRLEQVQEALRVASEIQKASTAAFGKVTVSIRQDGSLEIHMHTESIYYRNANIVIPPDQVSPFAKYCAGLLSPGDGK